MSGRTTGPWLGAALLAACGATAVEAVLLQVKYRSFTGGFLNPAHLDGVAVPLFFAASLLLDVAAIVLFVGPALWITRGVVSPGRRLVLTAALAALPWAGCALARFGVPAFARDWLGYRFGLGALPAYLVIAALPVGALAAGIWVARFLPDRLAMAIGFGTASRRRGVIAGAVLVVGAVIALALAGFGDRSFQRQLLRKTSGVWAVSLGSLTDFDSDGYDLVRQPTDFAPFDGARHPWAKDIPNNGVDENGVGGDLPDGPGAAAAVPPCPEFVRRPDVLLIVLETFRADNLTAEVDGRPVTPVLRDLIAKGAITGPAYTHSAYTVPSLTHLFTGTMHVGESTSLIDDFNGNGYLTAMFSGQDESFDGLEDATGVRRAHTIVDARDDVEERTSASASSGSLTVPWQVVLRNLRGHLQEHGKSEKPLFAYVNFQDAHFPYAHRKTEPILTDDFVSRGEMGARHADRILRTYRNAAANVDKAIGELLSAWRSARGKDAAFVIVSDHGENIYENGMLGHGIVLNRLQTRIVFVAGGLPMTPSFPLGHTHVRHLVRTALSGVDTGSAARTDWIWQYVGPINGPYQIGAAWDTGGVVFNLIDRKWSTWGERRESTPFLDILHLWERGAYR